ncbi:MAG: hypothetical protein EBZ58_12605 [Bacteroidetes bacterium]|nr:hypothetical protein [Bacteroidota bacterium]
MKIFTFEVINKKMKTIKLIIACVFTLTIIDTNAQNIKLNISDMHIKVKDRVYDAPSGYFTLELNSMTDERVLFSNETVEVRARYKLTDFSGVKRSNMKNSSIKLTVKYAFIFQGKTIKREVERFYYLDDERTFQEKEKAVFKEGISNTIVEISYKGQLPE